MRRLSIMFASAAFFLAGHAFADDQEHCKSTDYQYKVCEDNIKHAWLIDVDSDADCIEGHSWGVNGNHELWVNHGCEGDFRVEFLDQDNDDNDNAHHDRCSGISNCVPCDSNNHAYAECGSNISSAWVARVYSSSQCVQNQSWGVKNGRVWVNHGCRADFSVQYGYYVPPRPPVTPPTPPTPPSFASCGAYKTWAVYAVPGHGEVFKHSVPGSDKFFVAGSTQGQIVRVEQNIYGCVLTVEFYQSQVSFIGDGDFNPTGRTSGLIVK